MIAPDEQTGLLSSYFALCDYLGILPRSQIVDYLISCTYHGEQELDFRLCFSSIEKPTPLDFDALTSALKFSCYFKKFIIQSFALDDETLDMIANIFGFTDSLTNFSIVNLIHTKTGILPIVKPLKKGFHGLKSLTICQFVVDDSGIEASCSALDASKSALKILILSEVGMNAKGLKDLMKLLGSNKWSKLKELDISDNRLGKSGSSVLAQWLLECTGLESLTITRIDVDLELVLESLSHNTVLSSDKLERLNISGIKLTPKSVKSLEIIIESTQKLEHIFVMKTGLKKNLYESLLSAIRRNDQMSFLLDVSANELGVNSFKKLGVIFPDPTNCLSALILINNDLGAEGMIALCKSMKNFTALQTVVLDSNISAGIFTKVAEVGQALASLVQDAPSLTILSVAGDGNYCLKGGVIPLLKFLCTNSTLVHLNIAGDRFPDEAFVASGLFYYELTKQVSSFTWGETLLRKTLVKLCLKILNKEI